MSLLNLQQEPGEVWLPALEWLLASLTEAGELAGGTEKLQQVGRTGGREGRGGRGGRTGRAGQQQEQAGVCSEQVWQVSSARGRRAV